MIVEFSDGTWEEYEEAKFAGGAQGNIYRSQNGKSVLKRYKSNQFSGMTSAVIQQRLDKLLYEYNPTRLDPYWQLFFAWPEKRAIGGTTASGQREAFIGYRMPLVSGMIPLSNYIFATSYSSLPSNKKGTLFGFLSCALEIARAAHCLAYMGLCFADFSEGNVLIDPTHGRAMLIDCDSLTVPGSLAATVKGTSIYCAPEIMTGVVTTPSIHTDRHALAVLFYHLLLNGHPLDGPNALNNDVNYYLGSHPVYIEHPTNTSNHIPQQRVKSTHLGPDIQRLCAATFVEGLVQPDRRPLPSDWMNAFRRALDQLIPCRSPSCRWHFFVARPRAKLVCPMCGTALREPMTLPFLFFLRPHQVALQGMATQNAFYVVAWPNRSLHAWHITQEQPPLFSGTPFHPDLASYATFFHDQQRQSWFLKNLALPSLKYTKSSRRLQNWIPCRLDEQILLTDDMCLQFGDTSGHYLARVVMVKTNERIT